MEHRKYIVIGRLSIWVVLAAHAVSFGCGKQRPFADGSTNSVEANQPGGSVPADTDSSSRVNDAGGQPRSVQPGDTDSPVTGAAELGPAETDAGRTGDAGILTCELIPTSRETCGACDVACAASEYCSPTGCVQPVATPLLALAANVSDFVFDTAGNLYLTGSLTGPVDFGNGEVDPGVAGGIFLVKYGPARELLWVETFSTDILDLEGLSPPASAGIGIALDDTGNVYVTGVLYGAVDFGGGVLGDIATNATEVYAASGNVFVASYDPAGAHRWSNVFRSTLGPGVSQGVGIAVGNQGVYVVGNGVAGLDLGNGTIGNLQSSRYLFLAAFEKSGGASIWSLGLPFDASGFASMYDLVLDSRDNLYVGGFWRGQLDFGSGSVAGGRTTPTNGNAFDTETAFVASYTASAGTLRWVHVLNDDNYSVTNALAIDGADNVYAVGRFVSPIDLGGGLLNSGTDRGNKLFAVSYANDGTYRFDAIALNQVTGASSEATGASVSGGNLLIAAAYAGPIEVGSVALNSRPLGADVSRSSTEVGLISLDAATGQFGWARHFGSGEDNRASRLTTSGDAAVFAAYPRGILDVDGVPVEPPGENASVLIRVAE
jgi:hypothetical protein